MIRVYKVESDHLKQLDSLQDVDTSADVFWIDLVVPTLEEDRAVEEFLKISIPTREDMEEIELSARLYDEAGAEYMTVSAIAQVHLDDPVKTPVSFILSGRALVTVRYEELLSFSEYLTAARKRNGVTIASPQGLMLDILEAMMNRIADSLEALGGDIESISRDIFRSKKISVARRTDTLQVAIRKIGAKGDLLSMLRESLASVSRLLLHRNVDHTEGEGKAIRQKLSSLIRDVNSLVDHAGFLSGKMNFLLDATLGMINLEQNQIIKIFSIAAVVFLPPTLVASIYGMNFAHMPELEWFFGYPLAVFGMIVSAIIPLLYFKKKGWL